jgi:hypothetical protein
VPPFSRPELGAAADAEAEAEAEADADEDADADEGADIYTTSCKCQCRVLTDTHQLTGGPTNGTARHLLFSEPGSG